MKLHGKKTILTALILSGIFTAGGTTAYMTGFAQKINTIAVGRNTTVIEENFPKPSPKPISDNPEYTKTVWVSNRTSAEAGYNVDCFVRAALSYSNSDIGQAVSLKNLNTTDWEYHSDGYYYYKKVLKEGQSTSPLFTGFSIRSDLVDPSCKEYISDFSISVYEESVQAGDFSDFREAWNYYLNPIANT